MIDATGIGELYLSPPVCHEQKNRKEREIMRAWLYCRVANGWSADASDHLALQKTELERFCAEHDLTIVGTTLVTGNGRDELLELAHNAVEQDTFDVLAAVSISRFGGDIRGILQIGQELSQCGKGLCLVKENICTLPDVLAEQTINNTEMGGQML